MTLSERQAQLADFYRAIPDSQERLSLLVSQAPRHSLAEYERTAANRVLGCVSQVWIVMECRNGRCYFRSQADSPLVAGLVHALCQVCDGAAPQEILTAELSLLKDLGIFQNLSPTRQAGLENVVTALKKSALAVLHHAF